MAGLKIEFPGQAARDSDRTVIGGGYSQFFASSLNPLIFVGLYSGDEEQQLGNAPQLDYDFTGIRLGTQAKFTRDLTAFLSTSLESREYGGTDPFFLIKRKDDYTTFTLGAVYQWNRELTVSPEITTSENDSNIDFYDTDKTAYSVTARYQF